MEFNHWTSKLLKAVPGQKEMDVVGNGKTHTKRDNCISNRNSSQDSSLVRGMSILNTHTHKTISPNQS